MSAEHVEDYDRMVRMFLEAQQHDGDYEEAERVLENLRDFLFSVEQKKEARRLHYLELKAEFEPISTS